MLIYTRSHHLPRSPSTCYMLGPELDVLETLSLSILTVLQGSNTTPINDKETESSALYSVLASDPGGKDSPWFRSWQELEKGIRGPAKSVRSQGGTAPVGISNKSWETRSFTPMCAEASHKCTHKCPGLSHPLGSRPEALRPMPAPMLEELRPRAMLCLGRDWAPCLLPQSGGLSDPGCRGLRNTRENGMASVQRHPRDSNTWAIPDLLQAS